MLCRGVPRVVRPRRQPGGGVDEHQLPPGGAQERQERLREEKGSTDVDAVVRIQVLPAHRVDAPQGEAASRVNEKIQASGLSLHPGGEAAKVLIPPEVGGVPRGGPATGAHPLGRGLQPGGVSPGEKDLEALRPERSGHCQADATRASRDQGHASQAVAHAEPPAVADRSSRSKPPRSSIPAARASSGNVNPERSAMSRRDRVPSDWLRTQSIAIWAAAAWLCPPTDP